MSSRAFTSKNKSGDVITTTFDCACGLKINKSCPKAVALQKRLHLKKCEVGRQTYEQQKKSGQEKEYKYRQTTYGGGRINKSETYSTTRNVFGGLPTI